MNIHDRFLIAILGLVAIAISGSAQAQESESCPEGKSPITITTPSGKTKNLCVANSALPGLENASENSAADIIPAQCPCFTKSEAEALLSNKSYTYSHALLTAVSGEAEACEQVKILSTDGQVGLGALTTLIDSVEGCFVTVESPLGSMGRNGCQKYQPPEDTRLVPIERDESAACVAILKTFDPNP